MAASLCLQEKSVNLVLESWRGIEQLLTKASLSVTQFETICRSTTTAACETIADTGTGGFVIVHDFGKVVLTLCACESKGDDASLELGEMLSAQYAAAALFKSRRGDSTHVRALAKAINVVIHERVAKTSSVESCVFALLSVMEPLSQDATPHALSDLITDTAVAEIRDKSSPGNANHRILQYFDEPKSGVELSAEIRKAAAGVAKALDCTPEHVYGRLAKKQVAGVWEVVGRRLLDCADAAVMWRCALGTLTGGVSAFKFLLGLYMALVYYHELLTRKKGKELPAGLARIKDFAQQQQKKGHPVPQIFKE